MPAKQKVQRPNIAFENIKDQLRTALTAIPRGLTGDLPGAIRESAALQIRQLRRNFEAWPENLQKKLSGVTSALDKVANALKPTSPYEGPPLPQVLGLKWPNLLK